MLHLKLHLDLFSSLKWSQRLLMLSSPCLIKWWLETFVSWPTLWISSVKKNQPAFIPAPMRGTRTLLGEFFAVLAKSKKPSTSFKQQLKKECQAAKLNFFSFLQSSVTFLRGFTADRFNWVFAGFWGFTGSKVDKIIFGSRVNRYICLPITTFYCHVCDNFQLPLKSFCCSRELSQP